MQDCVLQLLCSTLITLKMCSHSVCACIGVGSGRAGRAVDALPIFQHTIMFIKIKTWLIRDCGSNLYVGMRVVEMF